MKIRGKISLLMVGLSLISLITMSLLTLGLVKELILDLTLQRLTVVSDRVANRVGAMVIKGREKANTLASFSTIQNYFLEHKNVDRPILGEPLLVDLVARERGEVNHLTIIDKNHKVIATDNLDETYPLEIAKIIPNKDLMVMEARQNGTSIVVLGKMLLPGGESGYLLVEIPVVSKVELLAKTDELGETGEVLLLYQDVQDPQKIRVINSLRFPGEVSVDVPELRKLIFSSMDNIYQGMTDYRGKKVVAVGKQLPAFDWAVAAKIDETEIMMPLKRMAGYVTWIGVASAILLMVVSWLLAGRYVRPIQVLTHATKNLVMEKKWLPVTVKTNDEVEELANSINLMMGEIQNSQLLLEDRVKHRTEELNRQLMELAKLNQLMTGRELRMIELKKEIQLLKENNL